MALNHIHTVPRRILVRGVNWLGDAVMTTPALLRLREKFPAAHITLLCAGKLGDLFKHHPAVDEIITFNTDESVLSIGKKLRAGKFDLAIVLPNSPRSGLEVWLAGIPQRLGYDRPWRNFLLTQIVPSRIEAVKMRKRSNDEIQRLVSPMATAAEISKYRFQIPNPVAHQTYEYLQLTAALGANPQPLAPLLAVTASEMETVKNKFGLEKLSQPIFGLNPGAEYGPAKRWPVEQFIAAATEIQRQTNCFWLIFGGKNDEATSAKIHASLVTSQTSLNLAGKTNLRELMATLKLCRVLLTNDTGPMHVAAALGTPVVVPFGSTSPELTGPGLPGDPRHQLIQSDAPCSPCFLRECPIDFRCMNGISVDRVVEAVIQAAAK